MGSRTLPTECEHGVVADWGDFGPDPDDGMVGVERCEQCEAERPNQARILVEWQPSASIGETDAVRHLLEGWCGQLMERLLDLGVVDPTVELDASGTVPADQSSGVVHIARGQSFASTARTEAEALAQLDREETTDG